jgi:hypothetical protein
MTQIETNGRTIIAVNVPENTFDFTISEANYLWWRFRTTHNWDEDNKVQLPRRCKIIGLLSELTEAQCEPYAPFVSPSFMLYDLFQSKGIDTMSPLLLIEKIK